MAGEEISEEEIQRRLELVGVRERPKIELGPGVREKVRDVGWREAIFGRKMIPVNDKEDEEEVKNWARSGMFSRAAVGYIADKSSGG